MKILNLYSGIGGNRELWDPLHEITSVEYDHEIAREYQVRYPDDNMRIEDAHEYLLNHFKEFDFIWSSPPCPTHSRARHWGYSKTRPVYPDMRLYEEILLLKHHFEGFWVVENVNPYYEPLIPGSKVGRHLFWSNFRIGNFDHKSSDVTKLSGTSKTDKWERNKTDPEIGEYVLNCALGIIKSRDTRQESLF